MDRRNFLAAGGAATLGVSLLAAGSPASGQAAADTVRQAARVSEQFGRVVPATCRKERTAP